MKRLRIADCGLRINGTRIRALVLIFALLCADFVAHAGQTLQNRHASFAIRTSKLATPTTFDFRPSTFDSPENQPKWSVLLFTIDSCNASRMSLYGNPIKTTPNLDDWAQQATVFDRAYSVSAWTAPGLVSILSGVLPGVHRVDSRDRHAPEKLPTLLKSFQQEGYQVPNLNFFTFAPYYQNLGLAAIDRSYFTPNDGDELLNYLDRNAERRFFIWYHTTKVHQPYNPPDDVLKKIVEMSSVIGHQSSVIGHRSTGIGHRSSDTDRRSQVGRSAAQQVTSSINWDEAFKAPGIQAVRHGAIVPKGSVKFRLEDLPALLALYDSEIYKMDRFFGQLLEKLRQKGLEDQTLLVVTADHGEEMLEHGFVGHASTSLNAKLYEELVHIPLVIRVPGQKNGARVSSLVQQIDIAPTILDLMHAPVPEIMQGRSLKQLIRQQVVGQQVAGQQVAGQQVAGRRSQVASQSATSGQEAGATRQKAGGGGQKAEGGRQKAERSRGEAGGGRQETGGRGKEAGVSRQEAGGRRQEAGGKEQKVVHSEVFLESVVAGNQTTKEREDLWFRGIRTGRTKYIQDLKAGKIILEQLFDLSRDPREQKNLAPFRKSQIADFRRRVTQIAQRNEKLRQQYLGDEFPGKVEGQKSKVEGRKECPVVEMPEPNQTLDYHLHTGAMLFQWKGDPNAEFVIEYDIGVGDHHVAGQYEAKGNYQILGPFPPELWVSLKAWNPFKIRVAYKGTECWSEWRTFYF
jgi:arylsulfatase A-like enzyme